MSQQSNAGANISINILYEDNHLLVVEKPVNIPTQEDASGDPDLLSLLKEDIKARYNKPGNVYLGLVHRLDRPVGGAMVFAKTSKAASRLSDQVRTHAFGKEYLAVIHGLPSQRKGRLEHYLLKNQAANMVKAVPSSAPGSKHAVLEYEVMGGSEHLSLVRIHLLTGRSHQIRVQFAVSGHPLFGDQKYGANVNTPGQQIALWSYRIRFHHPTTKQEMEFSSHPPDLYPWNMFSSMIKSL
ncbi:MAG TPA: RluA family pseudouridine synthase [Clostridiales bacterium]|nr:RluA family pseudouridine synthase [Clostridiales bacterium]